MGGGQPMERPLRQPIARKPSKRTETLPTNPLTEWTLTVERLQALASQWQGRRVLVVGDLMLDEYIVGNAERISPEAPVPVILCERRTYGAGGAANTAMNLLTLGAQVVLCGVIGNDWAGEKLRARSLKARVPAARRWVAAGVSAADRWTEARDAATNRRTEARNAAANRWTAARDAARICAGGGAGRSLAAGNRSAGAMVVYPMGSCFRRTRWRPWAAPANLVEVVVTKGYSLEG